MSCREQMQQHECVELELFDQLAGAGEQRRRHFEAKCPDGLEVDDYLNPRDLLHLATLTASRR